jgi:hypothetical protein
MVKAFNFIVAALWGFSTFLGYAPQAQAKVSSMSAIESNTACFRWRVVGACGFKKIRVNHWIPVAYVEVLPNAQITTLNDGAPANALSESQINGVPTSPIANASASNRRDILNNAWDVNVFNVTETAWRQTSMAIGVKQRVCSVAHSFAPLAAHEIAAVKIAVTQQIDQSRTTHAVTESQCKPTQSAGYVAPGNPLLQGAYSSAADFAQWRSGCRDKSASAEMELGKAGCESNGAPKPNTNPSACIGQWGALAPRQSRQMGMKPQVAANKTAWRGLHMARTTGAVMFPVDSSTLINQAYPQRDMCKAPGTTPDSMMISPDDSYGWIVWRNVTCCV